MPTRSDEVLAQGSASGSSESEFNAGKLVVHTKSGPVHGFRSGDMRIFRGVPFAQPPIGDLRWRPPQPHPGWKTPLNASSFGPACMQLPTGCWDSEDLSGVSEDCLTINIVTPAQHGRYPVMVYFLAGEFHCGSSSDSESRFPYFAKDIVLVTPNYRVGPFGFLAMEELRGRSPNHGTGNYGMLDQSFALQWVKDNIEQFGGDAGNVIIWGESSGGTSVGYHLTAYGAQSTNLFHKAILQSPGLTQVKTWTDATTNAEYLLAALAAASSPGCQQSSGYVALGDVLLAGKPLHVSKSYSIDAAKKWCNVNSGCAGFSRDRSRVTRFVAYPLMAIDLSVRAEGFAAFLRKGPSTSSAKLACLLGASADVLNNLTHTMPRDDTFYTDAWAPVLDGVDLAEPIQDRIHKGAIAPGVPLLLGSNLDEGTEFMYVTPPLKCNASHAEFQVWADSFYGDSLGPQIEWLYNISRLQRPLPQCSDSRSRKVLPGELAANYMSAMRSAGDKAIMCPTRKLASQVHSSTYVYRFDVTPTYSVNFPDTSVVGAFHGAEVPFVFGDKFELKTEREQALSAIMGCLWRSFAHHGDPGRDNCGTPQWPPYNEDLGHHPVLTLGDHIIVGPEDEYTTMRCTKFSSSARGDKQLHIVV